MPILEIKEVTKNYGDFTAVEDVSMAIEPGEVYGFIGPNGAGKSTTIRMIIGAIGITKGQIFVDGMDVSKDKKYLPKISYVPGDVSLWPNLTGMEVINFLMAARGYKDTKRRDELIETFRLDPHKKSKTYSKGNRQKVALISAFCSDAELYIFDEPTSGLDPLMEHTFHEEVKRLKQEGKSVLLSSHILSEVEKLADRISIIKDGKIVESGRFSELSHITRMKYIIESNDDLSPIKQLDYVHNVEEESGQLHLLVDNESIPDFLNELKTYKITHLETEPAKLEDIFLRFYEASR